jgi:hypothetical protein
MPKMQGMVERYKDRGLVLIGIHTKSAGDRMPAYVKEASISFPVALDHEGKTIQAFRVDSYPDYYLIDRSGILRVADLSNGDLERVVQILLEEPAPE